ncbi:hypothetical protein TR2A62_3041 [Thalassobium sp. R2A62]|nr:hypothetical protein TR2A62_3041 [Thalassobium sp. R2A62]
MPRNPLLPWPKASIAVALTTITIKGQAQMRSVDDFANAQ